MHYRFAAWAQALLVSARARALDQRGQGTVEYVGVVVMVTLLVAAVAAAAGGWADEIGKELEKALKAAIKRATQGLNG